MIGLAVNMLTGEPGCLKRRILKVKADEPTPQILAVISIFDVPWASDKRYPSIQAT